MPAVLERQILIGVPLWQVLAGVAAVLIVLTVWNRIARANMKLPGKR